MSHKLIPLGYNIKVNKYQTEEEESMAQFNITLTEEELHGLFLSNSRDKAISKLLEKIFNEVLRSQSTEQLGAKPYERTDQRKAYRNGYYDRDLTTRVGTLNLSIPRDRKSTRLNSSHVRIS